MNEHGDVVESEVILPKPLEERETEGTDGQKTTFRANGLDVTALGALASGILVLVTCLTCGQAFYCLPLLPLLLGFVGLAMAKDAVNPKRTRLWSWLGIGSGTATILLVALAIAGYLSFVLLLIVLSDAG